MRSLHSQTSKNAHRRRLLVALAGALAATQACKDSPAGPSGDAIRTGPPAAINVSQDVKNLVVGHVTLLHAFAFDSLGRRIPSAPFVWTTSDSKVATITNDGVVTALAPGAVTLTVTAGAASATATIGVRDFTGSIAYTQVIVDPDFSVFIGVYLYSPLGGRSLALGDGSRVFASAAWSPDGQQLAMDVAMGSGGDLGNPVVYDSSDVYVVPESTTSRASTWRRITNAGHSRSPSWSPSGDRIVYVSGSPDSSHIYTADLIGGDPVRLTVAPSRYSTPRWSPDGTRIAFADQAGEQASVISVMNADGTGRQVVSSQDGGQSAPSWSPDSRRLAFTYSSPGQGITEIFVVDAIGANLTRLTNRVDGGDSLDPVWSPDGRSIAFNVVSQLGHSGIHVMDADGSRPTRLTGAMGFLEQMRPSAWKP